MNTFQNEKGYWKNLPPTEGWKRGWKLKITEVAETTKARAKGYVVNQVNTRWDKSGQERVKNVKGSHTSVEK